MTDRRFSPSLRSAWLFYVSLATGLSLASVVALDLFDIWTVSSIRLRVALVSLILGAGFSLFMHVRALHSRIDALEEQRRPKLRTSVVPGCRPFVQTSGSAKADAYVLKRILRVGIANTGLVSVVRARTTTVDAEPLPPSFLPGHGLTVMGSRPISEVFDVRPSNEPTVFVDLVGELIEFSEASIKRRVEIQWAAPDIASQVSSFPTLLRLRVEGDTEPLPVSLKLALAGEYLQAWLDGERMDGGDWVTKQPPPEFDALASREPALRAVWEMTAVLARYGSGSHPFCANDAYYAVLKPWLLKLVGSGAREETLRDSLAYDVACDEIYRLLPPCRGCGCL